MIVLLLQVARNPRLCQLYPAAAADANICSAAAGRRRSNAGCGGSPARPQSLARAESSSTARKRTIERLAPQTRSLGKRGTT